VRRPDADLEAVRVATRRFLASIDELSDVQAEAPCRLPSWNRAELITHVARNADGIRGMVEAAARGEVAAMYPGGAEQRADGIAAGRDERAAVLVTDVRRASDRLADAWLELPADGWDRVGKASVDRRMSELPWVRWREVEVHHLDLGMEYEPADWPVQFVTRALDELLAALPRRSVANRPRVDARYRIALTDHDRAWVVALEGDKVRVVEDDDASVDGEVRGWGCDIAAWLYGRDPGNGGVLAAGDLGGLRLPTWFPFA
jgi:maleylpyruvate isomerase